MLTVCRRRVLLPLASGFPCEYEWRPLCAIIGCYSEEPKTGGSAYILNPRLAATLSVRSAKLSDASGPLLPSQAVCQNERTIWKVLEFVWITLDGYSSTKVIRFDITGSSAASGVWITTTRLARTK